MGVLPHLRPPMIFFKNWALSLLYHYGALTSCKKLEKTNEQSLTYLKMDQQKDQRTDNRRMDGQGRLLRTPLGKPGVQNRNFPKLRICPEVSGLLKIWSSIL